MKETIFTEMDSKGPSAALQETIDGINGKLDNMDGIDSKLDELSSKVKKFIVETNKNNKETVGKNQINEIVLSVSQLSSKVAVIESENKQKKESNKCFCYPVKEIYDKIEKRRATIDTIERL